MMSGRPRVRRARRRNARQRRFLAWVFALIFAPAVARQARAVCVEPRALPAINVTAPDPWSVTTADIDGDGDADAVAASYSGNAVSWFANDGSAGGWTEHVVASGVAGAIITVAGDFDRDGDLDLATGEFVGNRVSWHENTAGDGSTWNTVEVAAVGGARGLAAADVDGDGDLDLVAASYSGGSVSWLRNDADGASWVATPIGAAGGETYAVAAADLDGDGDVDVVAASQAVDRITWFSNDAPGSGTAWTAATVSATADGATAVAVADLDRDGDLDVVSGSLADTKVVWYANDGFASGWAVRTVSTTDGAISVVPVDLDRDGDVDLIAGGTAYYLVDNTSIWLENGGGDVWRERLLHNGAGGVAGVAAADLDGDGDLDTLTALRGASQLAVGRSDRFEVEPTLFTAAEVVTTAADLGLSVAMADLDGDGDGDAISASYFDNTVAWYPNNGLGGWGLQTLSTAVSGAQAVAALDVDGDGDLDVAFAGHGLGGSVVGWFANDGSWTRRTVSTTAAGSRAIAGGDLDGDGDVDLLSASYSDDRIAWYENTAGNGTAWTARDVSVVADVASDVGVADIDRDGDLDVLSASTGDSKLAWYENDRTPTVGAWPVHVVSTEAVDAASVATGDIDGDGFLDVVAATDGANKVSWYRNDGNGGGWQAVSIPASTSAPTGAEPADVDGDGDLDVVVSTRAAEAVAWFENNGSPLSPGWQIHTVATAAAANLANGVAVGDLDQDGDVDVLAISEADDRVTAYRNDGDGELANGFERGHPYCWPTSTP